MYCVVVRGVSLLNFIISTFLARSAFWNFGFMFFVVYIIVGVILWIFYSFVFLGKLRDWVRMIWVGWNLVFSRYVSFGLFFRIVSSSTIIAFVCFCLWNIILCVLVLVIYDECFVLVVIFLLSVIVYLYTLNGKFVATRYNSVSFVFWYVCVVLFLNFLVLFLSMYIFIFCFFSVCIVCFCNFGSGCNISIIARVVFVVASVFTFRVFFVIFLCVGFRFMYIVFWLFEFSVVFCCCILFVYVIFVCVDFCFACVVSTTTLLLFCVIVYVFSGCGVVMFLCVCVSLYMWVMILVLCGVIVWSVVVCVWCGCVWGCCDVGGDFVDDDGVVEDVFVVCVCVSVCDGDVVDIVCDVVWWMCGVEWWGWVRRDAASS